MLARSELAAFALRSLICKTLKSLSRMHLRLMAIGICWISEPERVAPIVRTVRECWEERVRHGFDWKTRSREKYQYFFGYASPNFSSMCGIVQRQAFPSSCETIATSATRCSPTNEQCRGVRTPNSLVSFKLVAKNKSPMSLICCRYNDSNVTVARRNSIDDIYNMTTNTKIRVIHK
jgi:hypothetical protein